MNDQQNIGFDFGGDCYEMWKSSKWLVAYDAMTVVCVDENAADRFEEECKERGVEITNRRSVTFSDGPQGYVVRDAA